MGMRNCSSQFLLLMCGLVVCFGAIFPFSSYCYGIVDKVVVPGGRLHPSHCRVGGLDIRMHSLGKGQGRRIVPASSSIPEVPPSYLQDNQQFSDLLQNVHLVISVFNYQVDQARGESRPEWNVSQVLGLIESKQENLYTYRLGMGFG